MAPGAHSSGSPSNSAVFVLGDPRSALHSYLACMTWRPSHGAQLFFVLGRIMLTPLLAEVLRRARAQLPAEQLYVLRFEELLDQPAATLDRLFAFLGGELQRWEGTPIHMHRPRLTASVPLHAGGGY